MTFAKRRKLWRARVSEYESSGLSIHEWCKRAGIRVDHLRYWLRKFDEADVGQLWASVELVGEGKPGLFAGGITVRIGSASIDVQSGFDHCLLSEVLAVVSATC
jgi:hypothetical protein